MANIIEQSNGVKTISINTPYEGVNASINALTQTVAGKADKTDLNVKANQSDLDATNTQLADIIQVDVKQFGAKGDGVTDDTSAIRSAITHASTVQGIPLIFFPNSLGYLTSDTITVPINMHVKMDSPILYNGTNDRAALVIGSGTTTNAQLRLQLNVQNKNQSDWTNQANIGIQLLNVRNSNITVFEVSGFTIGLQCMAQSNGFAWNTVTLGLMLNCLYPLDVTNNNSNGNSGWANENLYFGGSFTNYGNINPSSPRYGIRINSITGDYYNNSNHFIKPDFELGTVSGQQSLPVLINYGSFSTFDKCRKESTANTIFATLNNASTNNTFNLAYTDTACTLQDNSTVPSNVLTQLFNNVKTQAMKLVYTTGNLLEKSCYYDGSTKVNISTCHIGNYSDSNVYKTPPNANTITLLSNGIQIGSYSALGIFVNTTNAKKFVISPNIINGSAGRLYIVCYDSSGNILTSAGTVYSNAPNRFQLVSTQYGGSFKTSSDSSGEEVVIVSSTVAKMRVLYAMGSNPLQITSFSIYTLDSGSCETMLGYDQRTENYATTPPTVGTWTLGKRLINDNPSVQGSSGSQYIIDGWICTVAGTPGTWVARRNLTGT